MALWKRQGSRDRSLRWRIRLVFDRLWFGVYRRLKGREWETATLVSLEHPDGTAAVLEDRGELWLTGDLAYGPGTGLHGYEPGVEGLGRDRIVVGGGLPPGAVGCEVIDAAGRRHRADAGERAWVIVFEEQGSFGFGTHPVRYFDEEGETVPRLYPEAWRKPVEDANEPCPACGATGWDEVLVLDDSRGLFGRPDGSDGPVPAIVCRECGHSDTTTPGEGGSRRVQLDDGTWFLSFGDVSDHEPSDDELRLRAQALMAGPDLSTIAFPVYMARNYAAHLGGSGGDGTLVSLTVTDAAADREGSSPEIQVTTEVWDEVQHGLQSAEALARDALWLLIANVEIWNGEGWPSDRPEAAMALWHTERRRRQQQAAAEAEVAQGSIEIDGEPEVWTIARSGGLWAAVRRHGRVLITVASSRPDVGDVSLQEIPDPASELRR